ncbi:NnrS family protein [uncultured Shimia sp.]|uniref:NnrS family protein n=1 Tax=uncultured Shimia sp. TaxID=573152 RepID=UPI002635FC7D|nr:NnrS family protein [uncultured Shimia sp.]
MRHSAFWQAPYRPLFTAAGVWAVLCIAWWPLGPSFGVPAPAMSPPVLWHIHELFFGFATAAVGGYLLTAMPNWIGKPPERGLVLKGLLCAWIAARLVMATFDIMPLAVLLPVNAAYLVVLAGLMAIRLKRAKAYPKLGFAAALLLLATLDATFLILAKSGDIAACIALTQLLLLGFALLLTFVGARMIPAFTQSWQQITGCYDLAVHHRLRARVCALLALLVAVVATVLSLPWLGPLALLIASFCALLTATGWRSFSTRHNPLLAGLHVAYLWLPLGLAALALTDLFPATYPAGAAKHALTIGAISGLILAVAGRAGSHTPSGQLKAPKPLILAMICLWLATTLRLIAPMSPSETTLLNGAALLWITAWSAFLITLRPSLIGAPVRPVLSGKKARKT